MRNVKPACLCAAAALAVGLTAPVEGTVIPVAADGLWHPFDVDDFVSLSGGVEWIDAQNAPGYHNDGSALTFNVTGRIHIKVTDGGFGGDRFQVFDNSILLGLSSTASDTFPSFSQGTNFDAAFADNRFSHAEFDLGAGIHNITGFLFRSALDSAGLPIDATVGALQITPLATAPEPLSIALVVSALGLAGGVIRRHAI